MGPYALSLIIVSLMDQPVQMVEVFTFSPKRSVQLSQTSVPRRYFFLDSCKITNLPLLLMPCNYFYGVCFEKLLGLILAAYLALYRHAHLKTFRNAYGEETPWSANDAGY